MRSLAHTCTVTPVHGPQISPHPGSLMAAQTQCGSATPPHRQSQSPTVAASHVRPHRISSPVSSALWAACPISTAAFSILCARSSGVPASSRIAASAILRASRSVSWLPTQQDTE
eukprot:GHVU01126854.1.p1 GENE.GHVU01126854.1~~GHVU01126854.1.p1  ORF type:complete len:115 (-),score=4.55 GHVU01126854.1:17-361(-)